MNKLRNFIREKKQNSEDIKIPRIARENDDFPAPANDIERRNAEILENNGVFQTKPVEITAGKSNFAYFLDGIERKKILFYYRSIPCIYGHVAAAVLGRADKKPHPAGLEKTHEALYLPQKHFPGDLGMKIIDTGAGEPMLPEQYVYEAHKEIQKIRGELEKSLVRQWAGRDYNKGWLFVDGRVEKLSKELTSGSNIVGVIKSHHACYFDYENQYRIYSMKKGERSCVFRPEDGKGRPESVFSWYLRLHYDKNYGTNAFGLIRVEVPADEELLAKADIISNWILLETKPVAFPASRWDRMIYPVKYCEDYLKSKAPNYARLTI